MTENEIFLGSDPKKSNFKVETANLTQIFNVE